MNASDETDRRDEVGEDGPTGGGPGDVEAAGETTAADMISGEPDTRPVGADTLVRVEGADDAPEGEDED